MSTPTITCLLGGTGPVANRSEEGGERRAIVVSTLYQHLSHKHQHHSQYWYRATSALVFENGTVKVPPKIS